MLTMVRKLCGLFWSRFTLGWEMGSREWIISFSETMLWKYDVVIESNRELNCIPIWRPAPSKLDGCRRMFALSAVIASFNISCNIAGCLRQ